MLYFRNARLDNQDWYLTNKENFGTYAFANDHGNTLQSSHEYATLRPVARESTSTESVSIPMTGYLTMRGSTEKKAAATYAEIHKRSEENEPYVNYSDDDDDDDDNEREL